MISDLPFFHSYNSDTKQLTLRGATHLPIEVVDFTESIEILDLSDGQLTDLPDQLRQLTKLRVLFLSRNPFTTVPAVLRHCNSLRMLGMKSCQLQTLPEDSLPINLQWLVLTDNQLTQLPKSIGDLTQLQKLSLAGNQLASLPDNLKQCQQLELMRLGANLLTEIPDWIAELPKLAWYGDASNPVTISFPAVPVKAIEWNDLELGALIGASPTSQVYQAEWKSEHKTVAVKIYNGGLTSDGQSDDDRRAHLAVGPHPNIIPLLGQLKGEPSGKLGIVLEWMSHEYYSLAKPPSLTSCTRDIYPAALSLSTAWVERVLSGVRSALDQLHQRCITHGDLYAHNLLVNAAGDVRLGDFGAASYYDGTSAAWRQRIEARAYAILESELKSRIAD